MFGRSWGLLTLVAHVMSATSYGNVAYIDVGVEKRGPTVEFFTYPVGKPVGVSESISY